MSVLLATGARLLLEPAIGRQFPFVALSLGVIASAAYGGLGPGLFATGLGGIAYYLLSPPNLLAAEAVSYTAALGFLAVALGITLLGADSRRARQRAEALAAQAFRDRDQLYITMKSMGEGVIVVGPGGGVVSMNSAAEALTGWTSEEARGQPHGNIFPILNERTREPAEGPVPMALRGTRITGLMNPAILMTRDGREIWIDDTAAPIHDEAGAVQGVVLVFRDITERLKGQNAQQLLASIVENSQDAIYGRALDGTITSWNAGAERLYGYSAGEILGQQGSILNASPGEPDPPGVGLDARSGTAPFDVVRRRRDGTLIDVSMSVSPLRNTAGATVGVATIGRDITSQKRAAAELQRAQERLRDEDRRKDAFIAVLAHELRNPLAPLRNALQILEKTETSGPVALESLRMAERQVNHLASLVDDLLDVARVTHGRIELRTERIDVSSALSRAAAAAQTTLEARSHELVVNLPTTPLWIEADAVRLAQILANLLSNAAQYTAPGGRIELSAEQRGSEAWIRVSDTGFGIPKEALPRIFDMFTQTSDHKDRGPASLGIGLRLVKDLVEMHGGRIEATSAGVGCGSVFLVRMLAADPPASYRAEAAEPASSSATPSPKRNILVVDDNVDAATSLALLLKLQGHSTRSAHSGPDALETIDADSPDIVVLDIGMPGMDGYEVARRIRQRVGAPPVTLIALTGWGQEHDRQNARRAGFDFHMTKPVQPGALQKVIAAHAV